MPSEPAPAPALCCMVRIGGQNRNWQVGHPTETEVLDAYAPRLQGGAARWGTPCVGEADMLKRTSDRETRCTIRNLFSASSWQKYSLPLCLAQRRWVLAAGSPARQCQQATFAVRDNSLGRRSQGVPAHVGLGLAPCMAPCSLLCGPLQWLITCMPPALPLHRQVMLLLSVCSQLRCCSMSTWGSSTGWQQRAPAASCAGCLLWEDP